MKRTLATLAAALLLPLALVACGGGGDADGEAAAPATTAAETETHSMGGTQGGTAGVSSPAADLEVTLDRLLGEHALLAMFATQKGIGGEEDFEAIAGALDANSQDLAAAVGSVYGDEAAEQFLDGDLLWRFHIDQFVAYTKALGAKDEAAQKQAVDKLMGYVQAQAAFFADATGADRGAVASALEEHVVQLKTQLDGYAARDFREAYAHMFMTGDALSGAIATEQSLATDGATDAAVDLRITLGRLLGEHAYLAMVATQKGYSGSKDFEQIAGALDANSQELAAEIGSVYGEEAAEQFLDGDLLWRFHIDQFVAYTQALAKEDEAAQQEAVDKLMGYVEAQSAFFAEATGADRAALREGLEQHVTQLKGQIDAYAAGDHEEAYRLAREAHAHMWETADALAAAIVAQNPDKFGGS